MFDQNFLNESDIDTLINLLLRSQQSRTREALCFSIGIDPKRLSFLRDSSDSDFFLLLIRYLNEIGDQEALCKLCCKELIPIFHKETYGLFLNDLAEKLNCSQEFRPNYSNNKQSTVRSSSSPSRVSVNPFNQLVKNKLITGGTILLIGLAGFILWIQNKNSNPPPAQPTPSTQPTTDSPSLEIEPKEYTHLQNLLEAGEWKQADSETQKIMLRIAGREKEDYLREREDLPKISCTDLNKIDQLWMKYSDGLFGFSVQKRIWKETNSKELDTFYEGIGWRVNQNRKSYNDLTFSLNAPPGHLPAAGEYSPKGRGGWVSRCWN